MKNIDFKQPKFWDNIYYLLNNRGGDKKSSENMNILLKKLADISSRLIEDNQSVKNEFGDKYMNIVWLVYFYNRKRVIIKTSLIIGLHKHLYNNQ